MLKVTATQRLNLYFNRHISIDRCSIKIVIISFKDAQRCLRERVDDLCEATRDAEEIDHFNGDSAMSKNFDDRNVSVSVVKSMNLSNRNRVAEDNSPSGYRKV